MKTRNKKHNKAILRAGLSVFDSAGYYLNVFCNAVIKFLENLIEQIILVLKGIAPGARNINELFGLKKFSAACLVFSMTMMAASHAVYTLAYFNDTEDSSDNILTATFLDFFVSQDSFETFIGKEALGEYEVASAVVPEPGSLDIQYGVGIEKISGDTDFCEGLDLEAMKNGIEVHDGDLFLFEHATSTEFGTWEFEFDLPPSVTNVGHGDVCEFEFVYTGWRDGSSFEQSGYTDEERISFTMKSKMIVMNEMLPNPNGSDSQDGLLGEWVELYNNGDTAVDVAGWVISELTDPGGTPTENLYTIVGTSTPAVGEVRTASGSTVISPGGFAVILFEASRLNNIGDTVTLYDLSAKVMDSHTYVNGEAPEGKSIARIPDGIGTWVDPIPTPGGENTLEGEGLYSPLILSSSLDFGINENFAGHNVVGNWDETGHVETTPEGSAQDSESSKQEEETPVEVEEEEEGATEGNQDPAEEELGEEGQAEEGQDADEESFDDTQDPAGSQEESESENQGTGEETTQEPEATEEENGQGTTENPSENSDEQNEPSSEPESVVEAPEPEKEPELEPVIEPEPSPEPTEDPNEGVSGG